MPAQEFVRKPFRDGVLSHALEAHNQRLWDVECHGSPYRELEMGTTHSALRFESFVHQKDCYHHLHLHASPHLLDTLFRFRVGAAGLRAGLHGTDVTHRHCTLCDLSAVEDERHVVQDCPAYSTVRADPAYQDLFRALLQDGMTAFLNVEDQHQVARCLSHLLRHRRELLSRS